MSWPLWWVGWYIFSWSSALLLLMNCLTTCSWRLEEPGDLIPVESHLTPSILQLRLKAALIFSCFCSMNMCFIRQMWKGNRKFSFIPLFSFKMAKPHCLIMTGVTLIENQHRFTLLALGVSVFTIHPRASTVHVRGQALAYFAPMEFIRCRVTLKVGHSW